MKTESVSPIDLKIGDRVLAHGAQMEVTQIRESACETPGGIRVAACISRILGNDLGNIPRAYLDSRESKIAAGHANAADLPEGLYWNVQGNAHARVLRIVA